MSTVQRTAKMMSFSEFKKILDAANPLYLVITGIGESLLNNELSDMIRYAKQKNIIVKVDTNGFLLSKDISLKLLNSGLDYLSISLDTLDPITYQMIRIGGVLNQVKKNILYLVHAKKQINSKTKIEITLLSTKLNINFFTRTIEEICNLRADNISCGIAINLLKDNSNIYLLDEKNSYKLKNYIEIYKRGERIASSKKNKYLAKYIRLCIRELSNQNLPDSPKLCYFSFYNPFILSNGDMIPCCIAAAAVISNKKYYNELYMGNVLKEDFSKVWNSEKSRNIRRNIIRNRKKFSYCKNCFYNENVLFKPLGLFPKFLSQFDEK